MTLLDRLLGRGKSQPRSKNLAKQRLQGMLAYDRGLIAPGLLDQLRDEIVRGISKYVEVDQRQVELSLAYESGQSRLVAEIPLKLDPGRRRPPSAR